MSQKDDVTIIINSYKNIWDYEKKTYTLFDKIQLPFAIGARELVTFTLVEIILFAIWTIFSIPLMGLSGTVVIFGAVPVFITRFIKFLPFDGKTPVAFFKDYITFYLNKDKSYEFFRAVEIDSPEKKLKWKCGYRKKLTRRK